MIVLILGAASPTRQMLERVYSVLLAHLSIPGATADDSTEFACSKRDAERAIAESGIPYAILRPGFVLAPVDQVRIGDQSQDCQGTWSHHSA